MIEVYVSKFLSPEACMWTNRKSWNTIHSKVFIKRLPDYLGIFSNMQESLLILEIDFASPIYALLSVIRQQMSPV